MSLEYPNCSTTMRLHQENIKYSHGKKVRYIDCQGYFGELKRARELFQSGDILTINKIYIGFIGLKVEFLEFPGKTFNGKMFEYVKY